MPEAKKPLWGINLIAGVYALATLLLGWLVLDGPARMRPLLAVLALLSVVLCVGIFNRINAIRLLLVALLVVGLFVDTCLILYHFAAAFELVEPLTNKDPVRELARLPFRIALTATMFLYLLRPDVRAAFEREMPEQEDEPDLSPDWE